MFKEKTGEKEGQRRKRFLLYLRELPHPQRAALLIKREAEEQKLKFADGGEIREFTPYIAISEGFGRCERFLRDGIVAS